MNGTKLNIHELLKHLKFISSRFCKFPLHIYRFTDKSTSSIRLQSSR